MKKIAVVGTSGSGKTSLAVKLSQKLNLRHFELDTLFWKPNWTETSDEEFYKNVKETVTGPVWVVCGNYRVTRELLWPEADCIVWLDYPLHVCLWHGLKRTIRRLRKKETCCNGNYESVILQFFTKKSIFVWILTTYPKRKREYGRLYEEGKYPMVRLKSPKQAREWLEQIRD